MYEIKRNTLFFIHSIEDIGTKGSESIAGVLYSRTKGQTQRLAGIIKFQIPSN